MTEDLKMLYKIVWSYIRSCPGLEFNDLLSEACLAYLEAEKVFDPEKGKKSTFMWNCVSNALNDIISKNTLQNSKEIYLEDFKFPYEETPEQVLIQEERFLTLTASLSNEAKMICNLVLNEPDVFLPIDKPRECRGEISRTLRTREWSWPKIWGAFRELKETFSSPA